MRLGYAKILVKKQCLGGKISSRELVLISSRESQPRLSVKKRSSRSSGNLRATLGRYIGFEEGMTVRFDSYEVSKQIDLSCTWRSPEEFEERDR